MRMQGTIDGVIDRLDGMLDDARRTASRCGYFTALYRAVTVRVRAGIEAGRFEDGGRMERLDVIFANRYLDAFDAWRKSEPLTRSWRLAFETTSWWRPLILQHLLMGINAHINLDLGVAAAATAPGSTLPSLRRDFDEISVLLGEMLDDVQHRIARVSPWMGIIDLIGLRKDEAIFTFGLGRAREVAWRSAERLSAVEPHRLQDEIDRCDLIVSALALPIRTPGVHLSALLLGARLRESGDVRRVIDLLAS